MKNVYSLGAYQINQQDFKLDILYENPELGAPVNFLTEGNWVVKVQANKELPNSKSTSMNHQAV